MFAAPVRDTAQSFNIQYRRRHVKTGDWIWLLFRATVVESAENGAPLRIVGTDTDISDIKKGEVELEQLNRKMQLAIGVSGIGIWEFDVATSKVHWDDRLLEIYGLEAGQNEKSGDFWERHLHPDDKAIAVAHADECARTKGDLLHDFRIVRPDGEIRHLRTMARYADLSATQTKLYGVNIDITADVMHAKELERARKQLEYDSRHDALTGLANRRYLDELMVALTDGADDARMICVMHLDLDHFKNINDTLGHGAGDAVLVHVAKTLKRLIGTAGMICRMGGDEFVVVFETPPSDADLERAADAIIAALRVPFMYQGSACNFGVSIGAAIGAARRTLEACVFAKADVALYAAKNAGKSCFRLYCDRSGSHATGFIKRRQDILDAIASGGIECWYQPQFDPQTLSLIGAEALVRLRNADLGVLQPADFLPLADEAGLLPQVEERVTDCVLRDQSRWSAAGLVFPRVSVNVSLGRLGDRSLIDQIGAGIKPHHNIALELLSLMI